MPGAGNPGARGRGTQIYGHGLLAIFPLSANASDTNEVCRRALKGAREVQALVNGLEVSPRAAKKDAVRFGLALHVGDVKYGNIGGGDRLDFTCIGPAVNLAARLEKWQDNRRFSRICCPFSGPIRIARRVLGGRLRRPSIGFRTKESSGSRK